MTIKIEHGSDNVFKDLGFSDVEAANLLARSDLMILLKQEIEKLGLPRREVAKLLGVKPPRISELFHGRIDKFSVDLLIVYLDRLGKQLTFHISKKAA